MMRIIHRVSIASSQQIRDELAERGVPVPPDGFVTFEIDESDERWPSLEPWVAERDAVDVVSTEFSETEISQADVLELLPDWHHGFPQPERDFGYRDATYDATENCSACGIGLRQVAPFRMKKEPSWGQRSILQLNWVFDEYFVKPDVYQGVFQPVGIASWPVLDASGERELATVVQLDVPTVVAVKTDDLVGEVCSPCGRMRYEPPVRGAFPALAGSLSGAMAKTAEWFGSGASAHRRVLITSDLWRALTNEKVRGASVNPVEMAP